MIAQQRSRALKARRAMSNHARDIANSRINEQVIRSHEFSAARTIACYLPMNDEVDPTRIIRRAWCAKKRVFCPVIENNGGMVFRKLDRDTTLQRNRFGLWEPVSGVCVSSKSLDLVITPLVAFDTNNHRIGMGGGFFDRSFAFLKHKKRWLRPKLIGLAFACQKVEKIETNPWDIRLYSVISDAD